MFTLLIFILAALAVLTAPLIVILNGDDLDPWRFAPFRPIRRLVGLPVRPLKVPPEPLI